MSTGAIKRARVSQRSVLPTHSSLPARDNSRTLDIAVSEHGVFEITCSRRTFRISVGTQRRPPNAVDADVAPRPVLHADDEDDMDGMADRFDDNCRCVQWQVAARAQTLFFYPRFPHFSCCEDHVHSPRMIFEDEPDDLRENRFPA